MEILIDKTIEYSENANIPKFRLKLLFSFPILTVKLYKYEVEVFSQPINVLKLVIKIHTIFKKKEL